MAFGYHIGTDKMVTNGGPQMHQQKAPLLSKDWGPAQYAIIVRAKYEIKSHAQGLICPDFQEISHRIYAHTVVLQIILKATTFLLGICFKNRVQTTLSKFPHVRTVIHLRQWMTSIFA